MYFYLPNRQSIQNCYETELDLPDLLYESCLQLDSLWLWQQETLFGIVHVRQSLDVKIVDKYKFELDRFQACRLVHWLDVQASSFNANRSSYSRSLGAINYINSSSPCIPCLFGFNARYQLCQQILHNLRLKHKRF